MLKKYLFVLPFTFAGLASIGQTISENRALNSVPATHLNFDGGNDYISIASIPNPTGSFTIEAMAKLETKGYRTIFSKISNGYYGFTLSYNLNNDKMIATIGSGNSWSDVQSLSAWNLNQWYHVALVYDATSGSMTYYQDGVIQGTATISPAYSSTTFKIGDDDWTELWDGDIDEVRVWNVARTTAEIQNAMNCELSNPTSQVGLVAYYQFNQGFDSTDNTTITTLTDSSVSGYTGTLNNFTLNGITSNWLASSSIITGTTCSALSSNNFEYEVLELKVYPNPSSDIFQIQIQEDIQLEIFDVMGKMVLQKKAHTGTTSINLSEYAPGIYLLKVKNTYGKTKVAKIVKK